MYELTKHAIKRIGERVGINAHTAATEWVNNEINNAIRSEIVTQDDGRKQRKHVTERFEIYTGGSKVITVVPRDAEEPYIESFRDKIVNEANKTLNSYYKRLRSVDITVAENQLNFVKARNPNTKNMIKARMDEAVNAKLEVLRKIQGVKKAVKKFGIKDEDIVQ